MLLMAFRTLILYQSELLFCKINYIYLDFGSVGLTKLADRGVGRKKAYYNKSPLAHRWTKSVKLISCLD
jgi:hypothetical protein